MVDVYYNCDEISNIERNYILLRAVGAFDGPIKRCETIGLILCVL
jgi:hypothetical protein